MDETVPTIFPASLQFFAIKAYRFKPGNWQFLNLIFRQKLQKNLFFHLKNSGMEAHNRLVKYGRYKSFHGFTETRNSGFTKHRKITDTRHQYNPEKSVNKALSDNKLSNAMQLSF